MYKNLLIVYILLINNLSFLCTMKEFKLLFEKIGFGDAYFEALALSTKFKKRRRVLTAFDFVYILLSNASNKLISYNALASTIASVASKIISKQSLQKVMCKESCVLFFEKIWEDVLLSKIGILNSKYKDTFHRIIIQDSTIIKLPMQLFEEFSGVKNQFKQVANARIQFAFDLVTSKITFWKLDTYSKTDSTAAPELPIKKGDLLLRDRGYYSIAELCRIMQEKAFFIMRYKHGVNYYDPITGKLLNLAKILKHKKDTAILVRISSPKNPIVRLIASPVKEEVANLRRANCKKNASHNKKNTPSAESLEMLSWTIYITNIMEEKFDFKEIFNLYKLRWRIEILFKALKTNLQLDCIHNVSKNQLKLMLCAKMIMFTLYFQIIYKPLEVLVQKQYGKDLSVLKLISYLNKNIEKIIEVIMAIKKQKKKENETEIIKIIIKFCCYDKRIKRKNFNQTMPLS
jgi:Transposase DDE domain